MALVLKVGIEGGAVDHGPLTEVLDPDLVKGFLLEQVTQGPEQQGVGAQHPEVFGSAVHGHVLLGGMDTIILRDPGRPCQDRKRLREVPQAFPLVHWKRGGGHIQTDSGLFPVILPELGAKGNRQSGRPVAYPTVSEK